MPRRYMQLISDPLASGLAQLRRDVVQYRLGVHINCPDQIVFLDLEKDDIALVYECHRIRLPHDPWHAFWSAVADQFLRDRIEACPNGSRGSGQW